MLPLFESAVKPLAESVAESVVESDEHATATKRSNGSNAETNFIIALVLRLLDQSAHKFPVRPVRILNYALSPLLLEGGS